MAAFKAAAAAALKTNRAETNRFNGCLDSGAVTLCKPTFVDMPNRPNIAIAGDAKPKTPEIPPEVIAYQAVAELKLTAPKPLIGPSPDINRWHMAVVGYPYWLATSGDPTPAPVSDSVYDVSVSLKAHLDHVVFSMGDGHKITCTDTTHPWNSTVATYATSPWCGYTYDQPPLHSATYRVTTYAVWSVDWQINDTTGTLPFYQQSSIDLPVGELQVLVR